jgi:tetratricopeptide (TPR) repeat protein
MYNVCCKNHIIYLFSWHNSPFLLTQERHLDLEAPEVLARVHSLAVSLENLGERRDAAAFYRRAYEGRRKGLGDEHRDTLDSGLNLASCQRSLGEDAEALELFKNLLEGTRDHQGR